MNRIGRTNAAGIAKRLCVVVAFLLFMASLSFAVSGAEGVALVLFGLGVLSLVLARHGGAVVDALMSGPLP